MRTKEEQLEWDLQAYGCPKEKFLKSVDDWGTEYDMAAMSQCSDVQEIMAMVAHKSNDPYDKRMLEEARQMLNRAKMLIAEQRKVVKNRSQS